MRNNVVQSKQCYDIKRTDGFALIELSKRPTFTRIIRECVGTLTDMESSLPRKTSRIYVFISQKRKQ